MKDQEEKKISDLINAIKSGQEHFIEWDFKENDSAQNTDLSGLIFEKCFMFLDFKNSNLKDTQFIDCNIKTADFSGANLKNAKIKNCSVESTIFKGANTENLIFENNGYYGLTLNQTDFEKLKNSKID